MKKQAILISLCGALLMTGTAVAGTTPEFEAVGNDSANYFAVGDVVHYGQMVEHNAGPTGALNLKSNFPFNPATGWGEQFTTTAGALLTADVCYPGQTSAWSPPWTEVTYHFSFVLQMKPDSDLVLAINNCVLKANTSNLWDSAQQSGLYIAPWGQIYFVPSANPAITVRAVSGPNNLISFNFIMDGRTLPGLQKVALDRAMYAANGMTSGGIIAEKPATGTTNASGQPVYELREGDMVLVDIKVPLNNTARISYGRDSVLLNYVGVTGTEFQTGALP